MNSKFKHICLPISVCDKYYTDKADGKTYIYPDAAAGYHSVHPYDDVVGLVLDYLNIGYACEVGYDTDNMVYEFVSHYGFMTKGAKRCSADGLAEDMHGLYLHFAEICSSDYPDTPEWILETEPVTAVTKRTGNDIFCEWQTKNLAVAAELAYTLLLCDKHRYIGICKHCGKPYRVKNPKSEFCSAPCRNRFNVYKSRAKK